MSQEEIYKILKELGGEASTSEISRRAKEKFPNLTLYQYVGDRLRKLEKKGYVARVIDKSERGAGTVRWMIIEEYP